MFALLASPVCRWNTAVSLRSASNDKISRFFNAFYPQGVFLHILADTLGSAGVIVSAILMWAFGWMIADPICSIFIAILIGMSVWSMLAESVAILMQRTPKQLDHQLADCYQRVMQLEGVQGVHEQVLNIFKACPLLIIRSFVVQLSIALLIFSTSGPSAPTTIVGG